MRKGHSKDESVIRVTLEAPTNNTVPKEEQTTAKQESGNTINKRISK